MTDRKPYYIGLHNQCTEFFLIFFVLEFFCQINLQTRGVLFCRQKKKDNIVCDQCFSCWGDVMLNMFHKLQTEIGHFTEKSAKGEK